MRVWGREDIIPALKNAAKSAPKILKELELYFDMPLPVPKLDLIALPGYTAIPDSTWGVIFFKLVLENNSKRVYLYLPQFIHAFLLPTEKVI